MDAQPPEQSSGGGSPGEVFRVFLKLGLTSFGGPIAHLGYFRDGFVVRRRWISESAYADLVALCQFLPGPASSQVGFALGLQRAGFPGAVAAWSAFTAPSALLLIAFAHSASALSGPVSEALIHGLKLVAVAVVAQAAWGMARSLTPDFRRALIAIAAAVLVTVAGGAFRQIAAIVLGGAAGLWLCRGGGPPAHTGELRFRVSPRVGWVCLLVFVALLLGPPVIVAATGWRPLALFDAFYRSGALVFGGGHVVLPLLQAEVVQSGWAGDDAFLAGYGAAQAVPGPLFSYAAYLGFVVQPEPNGLAGAAIALGAVFLPGLLVLLGALPFWDAFRRKPLAQAALRGTNAAVVGILAAALYDPVWTSAVLGPMDVVIALAGFLALTAARASPFLVVLGVAGASVSLSLLQGGRA